MLLIDEHQRINKRCDGTARSPMSLEPSTPHMQLAVAKENFEIGGKSDKNYLQ